MSWCILAFAFTILTLKKPHAGVGFGILFQFLFYLCCAVWAISGISKCNNTEMENLLEDSDAICEGRDKDTKCYDFRKIWRVSISLIVLNILGMMVEFCCMFPIFCLAGWAFFTGRKS